MKVLAIALILSTGTTTQAGEVTYFDDRPASVLVGNSKYIGILVSEQSYRKLLKAKIDDRAKFQECEVDQQVCMSILASTREANKELKSIISKRSGWFERNRGSIAFVTGIVLGGAAVIATTKAVYQGQ